MTTVEPPSTETIRAVGESLRLAAILDDRLPAVPDRERIMGWAKQVQRHKLTRDDLVEGLQLYYDGPQDRAIQIGDLIHFGRQCRRYRTEQEDNDQRDARREAVDIKAADDQRALAAVIPLGPTPKRNRTARLEAAEIALQCCHGRKESIAAMREYFAAKTEAKQPRAAMAKGAQR